MTVAIHVKLVNVYRVNVAMKKLSSARKSKKSNVTNVKFKKLSVSSKEPNAAAQLRWFALTDSAQLLKSLLVDLARWLSKLLTNVDASLPSVNHGQLRNVQLVLNSFALVLTKKPAAQFLNVKLTTNARPALMLFNKKLKVNAQLKFVVHRPRRLLPPPAQELQPPPSKLLPPEVLPQSFLRQAQPLDRHVLASVLLITRFSPRLFSTPVNLSRTHAPL